MCEYKIPTHFRFKDKDEAEDYDSDTKTFHKIEEMHLMHNGWDVSTRRFAWVRITPEDFDNFEFKTEFKK